MLGTNFVSRTAVGPDGALYIASVDAGDGKLYKSVDGGVTFPVSSTPGMLNDWWQSLEVAPNDPSRLYLSGYRAPAGLPRQDLLLRSDDGGLSWNPLPVSSFTVTESSSLEIAAISKVDSAIVFVRVLREDNLAASAIYRSTDAGQTWTRVLGKGDTISLLCRANGELVAATQSLGAVRSTDNGTTWQDLVAPPHINCLVENASGEVWACTQNYAVAPLPSDEAGIMKSTDLVTWTKVLRYEELQAPVDCPVGTTQRDVCDVQWCALCSQMGCDPKRDCSAGPGDAGIDAPSTSEPPGHGGCCDSRTASRGTGLLVVGVVVALWRRRRRIAHELPS